MSHARPEQQPGQFQISPYGNAQGSAPTQPYEMGQAPVPPEEPKTYSLGVMVVACIMSGLLSVAVLTGIAYAIDSSQQAVDDGPSWPTQQQLNTIAEDGINISAEDYRWVTFATCGTYATFGAYHYVVPELLAGANLSAIRAMQASIAKTKDAQRGRNYFAKDMPDDARGPVDWPTDLEGLSDKQKNLLLLRVTEHQCSDLREEIQDRLFDGTGVPE